MVWDAFPQFGVWVTNFKALDPRFRFRMARSPRSRVLKVRLEGSENLREAYAQLRKTEEICVVLGLNFL